jgi:hypothetical protein
MANPSILAFSTTAADNGSGVTGVNAAENQPPSTVNDGIRGIMARLAFWRNWLAGNVTQGGTGNAYTFTSGETLTAYSDGMRIAWKPNADASGSVTLNVDAIGAKKVYRPDGTQATTGDVIANTIVDLVYQSALDSAAGGFRIVGTARPRVRVSAQYRLLGRSSASAGDHEEVASSADVFSFLGAADKAAARAALQIPEVIIIAVGDEVTALTTGTGKIAFRMPFAMTLTAVRGSLSTAQTAGSVLTVDVNEGGTTILSTKLTFDNNEKTTTTAATAAVISDTALADDAEITIDIDQVGTSGAKGLKVSLIGYRA